MLLKNKIKDIKSFLKKENILTSVEERFCYAKDAYNLEFDSKIPDMVVFVETIKDVQKILKYANEHSIPITARGAGTNMVGACIPKEGGIILNFSKMNKIIDVDPINMIAKVQPGVVLDDLKKEVEKFNLFYPPDPSNYKVSTIGGSIAQSSGGALSFKYGTTKDYVLALKIVTPDGKLLNLGADISKNAQGYHLAQLMVGSEGTLGVIVEATLKLIPRPEAIKSIIAYFNSASDMVNSINEITKDNIFPASIDFMNNRAMKTIEDFLPTGLNVNFKYAMLIDVEGLLSSIDCQIKKVINSLKKSGVNEVYVPLNSKESNKIWQSRRASYAATTRLAPDVISDDIIVNRKHLAYMINVCEEISQKFNINMTLVGHLGDGNLHPQYALNLENENDFRNYQRVKSEIYSIIKSINGSISAEHGIGIEKIEYLKDIIDENTMEYMKILKKSFDPKNILNPGKIFKL